MPGRYFLNFIAKEANILLLGLCRPDVCVLYGKNTLSHTDTQNIIYFIYALIFHLRKSPKVTLKKLCQSEKVVCQIGTVVIQSLAI